MALQTLNDEGHMEWQCPCGKVNKAHHSHDQVEYTGPHVVALPPCDNCGARMFLNAHFSEQDLRAPNMIDADGNTTASYDVAHRHMELHRRLQSSGKRYEEPPPPESLDVLVQREVARALEGLRSQDIVHSPAAGVPDTEPEQPTGDQPALRRVYEQPQSHYPEMPKPEAQGEDAGSESPEAEQEQEQEAPETHPPEGAQQFMPNPLADINE